MSITISVPRIFGGVVFVTPSTVPPVPPINVTWFTRDNAVTWKTRDSKVEWATRDNTVTWRTKG